MPRQDALLSSPDGRLVEIVTVGDPDGQTVFFHHGTPGAASLVTMFSEAGERAGLFFVAMSRPGYGASTRLEGRTVASVVDDVRTVLDSLGRDRYISIGWSGGGPHALACGALDAPRCVAVWSLAGVVPMDVDFDWTAGMGPENLEEFALSKVGGPVYEAHMAEVGEQFADANADNIVAIFGGLLADVDKAALASAESRRNLADSCRQGFINGYFGFLDDDRVFLNPWGFDVAALEVPVAVWYGDQDLMVPPTHGAWLASHVKNVTVVHKPEEGHLSIVTNHMDELIADLQALR